MQLLQFVVYLAMAYKLALMLLPFAIVGAFGAAVVYWYSRLQ